MRTNNETGCFRRTELRPYPVIEPASKNECHDQQQQNPKCRADGFSSHVHGVCFGANCRATVGLRCRRCNQRRGRQVAAGARREAGQGGAASTRRVCLLVSDNTRFWYRNDLAAGAEGIHPGGRGKGNPAAGVRSGEAGRRIVEGRRSEIPGGPPAIFPTFKSSRTASRSSSPPPAEPGNAI